MPMIYRKSYPVRVFNFYSIYRALGYSIWRAVRIAFTAARR